MTFPPKEKAVAATHTASKKRQKHYTISRQKHQAILDKSKLMSPSAILDKLGLRYWQCIAGLVVFCPFHKSGKEKKPSLLMHPKDGHFTCFACGKKGGDAISFYRAVTGVGFAEALKALEARHD